MTAVDILDAINAAVGCQQCGRSLGGSPSDDWCCEKCQELWLAELARQLDVVRGLAERLGIVSAQQAEVGVAVLQAMPPTWCSASRYR